MQFSKCLRCRACALFEQLHVEQKRLSDDRGAIEEINQRAFAAELLDVEGDRGVWIFAEQRAEVFGWRLVDRRSWIVGNVEPAVGSAPDVGLNAPSAIECRTEAVVNGVVIRSNFPNAISQDIGLLINPG